MGQGIGSTPNSRNVRVWRDDRRKMSAMPEHAPMPTDLLLAWGQGDAGAFDRLVPLVHSELRRLARHYMGTVKRDWRFAKLWLLRELGTK